MISLVKTIKCPLPTFSAATISPASTSTKIRITENTTRFIFLMPYPMPTIPFSSPRKPEALRHWQRFLTRPIHRLELESLQLILPLILTLLHLMSEEILIWPSTKINNGVTKEAKLAFIGTLLYFSLLSSGVWAGATSYYHPTDGTPLQWQTDSDGKATIEYLVDAGGLGRLTHEQSLQLLQAAMAIWEAEANVEFVYSGPTNEIIDGNNYRDYLVVDESICTDSSTAESVENALQFDRISIIGFDNTANTIMND